MEQEYTVGPAGFRALCARKSGAFLETGSFYPPPAALRLFPLLGFPAHTLHPQGVCGIRKAAEPLTAALPYRRGEFTTLSTVSDPVPLLRQGYTVQCEALGGEELPFPPFVY